MLDLVSNRELVERQVRDLRRLEYEALDLARHAADLGCPELAGQIEQIARMINHAGAVPEVLASRIASGLPPKIGNSNHD